MHVWYLTFIASVDFRACAHVSPACSVCTAVFTVIVLSYLSVTTFTEQELCKFLSSVTYNFCDCVCVCVNTLTALSDLR